LTCIKAAFCALGHIGSVNEEKEILSAISAAKKPTVVYACSGCSDAGEIADRVARQLSRDDAAQMSCLAGIGGRVKSLMLKAENAERILVVDGCPLNCAAHTLKLAGFNNFEHLELHKIGIRKGSCPVTDEKISAGVKAAKKILESESNAEKLTANLGEALMTAK